MHNATVKTNKLRRLCKNSQSFLKQYLIRVKILTLIDTIGTMFIN